MPYDHTSVEAKWQRRWREAGVHKTVSDPSRPKFYVLDMFPYPSGAGLHVGHCEGYTATDIIARYKRMRGFNVLHPFGWDAFGLPAENYAIKSGIHPRATTQSAIATFRRQIESLGFAYDWEREINTTDPQFYKWTQWIFLKMFERGLAYQATAPINWCPSCLTGLANEEVSAGSCERCGSRTERRNIRQWMLRITSYADRLLDDLGEVDWPESTLQMQRNWIGRAEGAEILFEVVDEPMSGEQICVFTTRPETIYGTTYIAISAEHALAAQLASTRADIAAYLDCVRHKSDRERTTQTGKLGGVCTGAHARNPVSGVRVPIWIADYVLASHGTGAIMGVPAHDARDHEFALEHGLPIRQVLRSTATTEPDTAGVFTGDGICINSGSLDQLATSDARMRVLALIESTAAGKAAVCYRLRDWVFSRQRYWGEPIPIVHCQACGAVPVLESELPLRLPDVDRYQPSGTGESPLATMPGWVQTPCPRCGADAQRETNTMPQWAGSCWYYLRYLNPHNDSVPWSREAEREWMNVDLYVGGAEHSVLHLLYARFWHKVLYDLGLVSSKEPFRKLRHQGTVLAASYRDSLGRYYGRDHVDLGERGPRLIATGELLMTDVEKMAKTKANGVNPDDVIRQYGADVLRLYEMFMGEFESSKPWDSRAIEGCSRFAKRVWRLVEDFSNDSLPASDVHERLRHRTIKKVEDDIEQMKFNTAIAALMTYSNALLKHGAARTDLDTLVKLVAPFAPHLAQEAWHQLRGDSVGWLLNEAWPTYDLALARPDAVIMAVQVNGKTRAKMHIERDLPDEQIRERALCLPNVGEHVADKRIARVIVVRDRIVNVVTEGT